MGRFIVSRSAAGDRFLLQSQSGRTVAVSKDYANLDACKKGICSLIHFAPVAPVVDRTKGEKGKNPKFEISAEKGGVRYTFKSANGKAVLTSSPFADKKACLRAVSMLRGEVVGADVVFSRPAGISYLTLPDTDAPTDDAKVPTPSFEEEAAISQTVESPTPQQLADSKPAQDLEASVQAPLQEKKEASPKIAQAPSSTLARKPVQMGTRASVAARQSGARRQSLMPTVPSLSRSNAKAREMAKSKGKQPKTAGIFDRFFKK